MSDIALMWHGSLQWGRREVEEWHFLVEIYSRSLDVVESLPDVKLTLQFGGQDVEWISHTHPEFVEKVKALLARGQVEVSVAGYSHDFQGANPLVNMANLTLSQDICQSVYGTGSAGYWPAESMLNRGMPRSLKTAGYQYTMFDSLNVQNAGTHEFDLFGAYLLGGAFGETITGLPQSRFEDSSRRGEGAGILPYALNPAYYDSDPAIVIDRVSRVPLVVEVSDWEHFNVREDKLMETHMGTSSIGSSRNAVDPDKIEAWREVLSRLLESGNRFLTCREAAEQHRSDTVLELIDGRDYTKNDLTRLVDACAWHDGEKGGLSGRKDPHYMSDQESYCYSFAGARALQYLCDISEIDNKAISAETITARSKDVCVSFCSAHRSGGEHFTVKQQVLDRINRAVCDMETAADATTGGTTKITFPRDLPEGLWCVQIKLPEPGADTGAILVSTSSEEKECTLEKAETCVACLDRTHRLWVPGPVASGTYTLRTRKQPDNLPVPPGASDTATEFRLINDESLIVFDKLNGGNIATWCVNGFSPFVYAGGIRFSSQWQDAPVCDEVQSEPEIEHCLHGTVIRFHFLSEGIQFERRYFVTHDLKLCQTDLKACHKEFIYFSPFRYRLAPSAFGQNAEVMMVAEGFTEISREPLTMQHNVHHLGSELAGFRGEHGIAALNINRLASSPMFFRNPWSGHFVLMDSRPVGHADNAFAYSFADHPVIETTLRVDPDADIESFESWQTHQTHQPILHPSISPLKQADMEWMKSVPHITEVNPFF